MYLQTTPTTFYVSAAFLMCTDGIFNLMTIDTNNKKLLFKFFTFTFSMEFDFVLMPLWIFSMFFMQ